MQRSFSKGGKLQQQQLKGKWQLPSTQLPRGSHCWSCRAFPWGFSSAVDICIVEFMLYVHFHAHLAKIKAFLLLTSVANIYNAYIIYIERTITAVTLLLGMRIPK